MRRSSCCWICVVVRILLPTRAGVVLPYEDRQTHHSTPPRSLSHSPTPRKASRVEFKVNPRRSRGLTLNETRLAFPKPRLRVPKSRRFRRTKPDIHWPPCAGGAFKVNKSQLKVKVWSSLRYDDAINVTLRNNNTQKYPLNGSTDLKHTITPTYSDVLLRLAHSPLLQRRTLPPRSRREALKRNQALALYYALAQLLVPRRLVRRRVRPRRSR